MSKKHIAYLESGEIDALKKLCKAALSMQDVPFFASIEAEAKSALAKLEETSDRE